jgi:hypothetical protein
MTRHKHINTHATLAFSILLGNNDSCVIPPTLEGWVYRQGYMGLYMGYTQAIWATLTYIHIYSNTSFYLIDANSNQHNL